jgi:hypothetical protein
MFAKVPVSYLGMRVTNYNFIQEENKSGSIPGKLETSQLMICIFPHPL